MVARLKRLRCMSGHRVVQRYLMIVLHFEAQPMAKAQKVTITVSTKGQVILPSAIRHRRDWSAGTRGSLSRRPLRVYC